MGATRYDYKGRNEFYKKLVTVAGISKGAANAYLTGIFRPDKVGAYKTASRHWENLMDIPMPTIDDVTVTHIYHDQDSEGDSEEESRSIELELSHEECLELIEDLKEERENLFKERKSLKTSIHLYKSTNTNLRQHVNHLIDELNKKLAETTKLRNMCDRKDKIIASLKAEDKTTNMQESSEVETLKAVIGRPSNIDLCAAQK